MGMSMPPALSRNTSRDSASSSRVSILKPTLIWLEWNLPRMRARPLLVPSSSFAMMAFQAANGCRRIGVGMETGMRLRCGGSAHLNAYFFNAGQVHARPEISASFARVELQDSLQPLSDERLDPVPEKHAL